MVEPGQAVYARIEDIRKPSGTIYTKRGSKFVEEGTLSRKGISSVGAISEQRESERQRIEAARKAQEEAKRIAEQKAIDEANKRRIEQQASQRKAQQEAAKQELRKIQERIASLKRRGSEARIIESRDVETKEKLKVVEYKGVGSKVRTVENLETGKIAYAEYGVPEGGGSMRKVRTVQSQKVVPKKEKIKEVFVKGEFKPIMIKDLKEPQQRDMTQQTVYNFEETKLYSPKELAYGVASSIGKAVAYLAPEEGIKVRWTRKVGEAEYLEPQFGTAIFETPKIKLEKKDKDLDWTKVPEEGKFIAAKKRRTEGYAEQRVATIFEKKRVEEGATAGTIIAGYTVAPQYIVAPALIYSGTKTALDPEATTKQKLLGAVEAGVGVGMVTLAATKWARTPITKTIPERPIMKPTQTVLEKQVKVGDKMKVVQDVRIVGEYQPPLRVIKTTKGRELWDETLGRIIQVGKKVKRPMIQLGRESRIPARGYVVEGRGFVGETMYFERQIQGQTWKTLFKVDSPTKKITLSELKQLPRAEQRLVQIQAEKALGRPISLENLPKVLGKKTELTFGYSKTSKLGRVKQVGKEYEISIRSGDIGRRTTRQIGISKRRLIEKTDDFDFFKVDTQAADITLPKKVERIKSPTEMETYIFSLKSKKVGDEAMGFIAPADIKRTPFLTTMQEKGITSIAEAPLPKPTGAKPSRVVLEEPKIDTPTSFKPLVAIESEFAGKGTYELTQVGGRIPGKVGLELGTGARILQERTLPSVEITLISGAEIKGASRKGFKASEDLGVSLGQPQDIVGKDRLAVKQKVAQKTKQETKQELKQELGQLIETTIIQKPRSPTPRPGKGFVPLPPIKKGSLAKRLLKRVETDGFEAFATIKGKAVSIGKTKTQVGAEKLLKKKLRKTLSASGFLEGSGKKIKASKLKTFGTGEFRLSKEDPFKIVEKKAKRLRKSTTGKEIQYFRKKRKTKGGF